ncbi:MAG: amidohydrolase family protein, partial [Alistipes sp.]|nr:amidohydrolase family protein [Candidatus Minthomonas equi]
MSEILLKNVHLPNGEQTEILIEDGAISRIGSSLGEINDQVIDVCGKYAIPGYYNMHTHAAMTLMRGYRDDMELFSWLKSIWSIEAHLDEEAIYWGTRLACLEMIKSGTICFCDMYFRLDSSAQAIADSGMKALLTSCFLDGGKEAKKLQDRRDCERDFMFSQKWPGSVRFGVSVHAPYTVCEENILWAADFARERGLPITIHVSETENENRDFISSHGISPVRYLEKLKFWGDDVILAH